MLYTYKECIDKYKSNYEISKLLKNGSLYRIDKGIYSDNRYENELAIINKLYPNAVFTLNSAFYYHGFTDVIPKGYYLLTNKDFTKIKDKRIIQFFDNNDSLGIGAENKIYNGIEISVFNKERMLIELIRNKNKFSFDYYKEIINNYRKLIHELDIEAIQEYAYRLPKTNFVLNTLQLEVF